MNLELKSEIERAEELYQQLKVECEKRMLEESVHPRILNLAVEVLVKLRSILDHIANDVFEVTVKSGLDLADAEKVKVYFPVADDEQSFRSQLGRSKFTELETNSPAIFKIIRDAQPFVSSDNHWLAILRDLSNEGKHVQLVRQVRQVTKRTTVTGSGGSVAWTNGVTFGQGVSVMGAPIDLRTQNIIPTPGIQSKTENLISFVFPVPGVNVLGFLEEAITKTEQLVNRLSDNV